MAKKNCLGGANGGRGSINEAAAAPEKRVISKDTVYPQFTKATPTSKTANQWILRVHFIRKLGAKVEHKFSTTKYTTREEASSYEAVKLAWEEIRPKLKAKNRTPFDTPGK
jgi:hypothetical protein